MTQIFNFSSDPTMLPAEVLKQAQQELRDWNDLGTSMIEVSRRGKEFTQVTEETEKDFRDLLNVPSNYRVLFYHGGDRGQFTAVPLNILGDKTTADHVDTGYWVASIIKEAKKCCTPNIFDVKVTVDGLCAVKPMYEWQLSGNVTYMYYCPDETIDSIAIDETPNFDEDVVVAVDFSPTILSRPISISRYSVIYVSAQKNIGPAGLIVVIVRENLLGKANIACSSILDYSILNGDGSMFNTSPIFAWYLSGLVLKWLKANGSVAEMDKINRQKAELLHGVINNSDFYRNDVAKVNRPQMNIPLQLADSTLDELFLEGSLVTGLHALKGHRMIGGMRTSIYNAIPLEGVKVLTSFIVEFGHRHG